MSSPSFRAVLHSASLAAVVATSCCTWLQPSGGTAPQAQARTFEKPRPFATLNTKEIPESSGLAASWVTPGDYFTHNDSGDSARFFKFDAQGKIVATFSLVGVEARDWEDIASAKINGQPYLFLGDIGDNQSRWPSIKVYRLKEPTGGSQAIKEFETLELTYPDGPHNAEALMVRPQTGDIYIVTKTDKGSSQVFKLDRPARSGKYVLKQIGSISFGSAIPGSKLITAGDISPDGKHVALRTYWSGYEFEASKDFDAWVKQKPLPFSTPAEMQGEALCYSIDGKALLTSSEGIPCKISIIPVR